MPTPPNAIPVLIPMLNPNEPEARLVSLNVQEGNYVSSDALLCTLETTKSTSEVLAEREGYIKGLRLGEGDLALAGDILCYIASSQDWDPPQEPPSKQLAIRQSPASEYSIDFPDGVRITQPALELARQAGIDLNQLPVGPLITAHMIEDMVLQSEKNHPEEETNPKDLIIFGGGGHGKTLIELIRAAGKYHIAGIVDDSLPAGDSILGITVLGGADVLPSLRRKGIGQAVNAIGGISNPTVRHQVFDRLEKSGFTCPTLIHPSAVIEPSAVLSAGVQVFSHAYIGSDARLGFGVIANTGVVVSHDCMIEDLANLSPGALLAGGVRVGTAALVGMGVTINLGVLVGKDARIGNGATIKADVPEGRIVRAGSIWPE
jgi:acetyltransferase EpsM